MRGSARKGHTDVPGPVVSGLLAAGALGWLCLLVVTSFSSISWALGLLLMLRVLGSGESAGGRH
jgi:hypothetical protein